MNLLSQLSKSHKIPLVGKVLGRGDSEHNYASLTKFKKAQDLALESAREIGKLLQPGWSEKKAANYLDVYLKDHGVKGYLHKPFAWFGERTRFRGCQNYLDYLPSKKVLKENEAVILDVAPIVDGHPADIGYSMLVGEVEGFAKCLADLKTYRKKIAEYFSSADYEGKNIWNLVDQDIRNDGHDNIHQKYPMHVLGHKLYPMGLDWVPGFFKPFTWQAYWSLGSRGLFSETLTSYFAGDFNGLWAIEPHLGAENFGLKFEEMLWVRDGKAFWLNDLDLDKVLWDSKHGEMK